MQTQFARGEIHLEDVRQRLMSWCGHAKQADTWMLQRRLFANISFQRAKAEKPRAAWRVVPRSKGPQLIDFSRDGG